MIRQHNSGAHDADLLLNCKHIKLAAKCCHYAQVKGIAKRREILSASRMYSMRLLLVPSCITFRHSVLPFNGKRRPCEMCLRLDAYAPENLTIDTYSRLVGAHAGLTDKTATGVCTCLMDHGNHGNEKSEKLNKVNHCCEV